MMENLRAKAARHLMLEVGNCVTNDELRRTVERVEMTGGKYLAYENGEVYGFMNLSKCLDFLGITD